MTLTLVTTLLVLVGAAGVGLYWYVQGALTRQFDAALLAKARALGALLRPVDNGRVEFDFTDNTTPEYEQLKSGEYFELWSDNGQPVTRSKSLGNDMLSLTPQSTDEPRLLDLSLAGGRAGRVVVLRITPSIEIEENTLDETTLATRLKEHYLLVVAREREDLNHALITVALGELGGLGALVAAFSILVPWLIGRHLRPVQRIAAQAGQIDTGALATPFPVADMPAELQPICLRLNESLDRLHGAFIREHRFSADVAHELRTPIAELRLLSEIALRFPKEKEDAARSFRDALDIARQMEAIVETLLEMIEENAPLPASSLIPVDLEKVLQRAWRAGAAVAKRRNTTWQMTENGGVTVLSEPAILERVLENLLANAVEYAPPESLVRVRIESLPDRAIVIVQNPTTGLEAGDLTHLAEPFWRKDASRTQRHHAGLGLALVVCYARRLGIKILWTLPDASVFQVRLEIPR
jgi:signal transduction histidine kinase